jgi:hypothetical protein
MASLNSLLPVMCSGMPAISIFLFSVCFSCFDSITSRSGDPSFATVVYYILIYIRPLTFGGKEDIKMIVSQIGSCFDWI